MATRVPAKSILKQVDSTPKATLSDDQKARAEKDRRNLSIALQHANRIQNQKDIQAQILSNIETLLDFPAGASCSSVEAARFASLVYPFQPSDFDSLVEERHIDGKCGYALCSNKPRSVTMGANAAWKLKGKGAEDYCSDRCLRKALYVKAQLSEVPAWERAPGQQPEIVLHEDDRPVISRSQTVTIDHAPEGAANERELALERGETTASFRPGQVMTTTIVEKFNNVRKTPSTVDVTSSSHTAIEGYEPGQVSSQLPIRVHPSNLVEDQNGGTGESRDVGDDEDEAWRELFDNVAKR